MFGERWGAALSLLSEVRAFCTWTQCTSNRRRGERWEKGLCRGIIKALILTVLERSGGQCEEADGQFLVLVAAIKLMAPQVMFMQAALISM